MSTPGGVVVNDPNEQPTAAAVLSQSPLMAPLLEKAAKVAKRMIILSEGEPLGLADVLEAERMGRNLSPSAWVSPVVPKALDPPASAPAVDLVEAGVGRDWQAREAEAAQAEKQQIEEALQATKGRIYGEHGAARLLGIGPEKLRYYMRKYGVKRPNKS